ncbi:P18 [Mocis latipes granulovirus]|uniref:P18 n=1 Tax=Mocis latipes granulovirus TaxID=2072024 RepID=A0A162GWW8_9BBAC|nr:P18 [Mocis latipes granulovirus]AKR17518.1 P18 [Mocis latipes granulovirus]
MTRVLNLYTFKPNNVTNGSVDDHFEIVLQGILESLDNKHTDKHACFLEIKQEQKHIFQKMAYDFIHHVEGTFFRNHILLDVLKMYEVYVKEFRDRSAFGQACVTQCIDIVYSVYQIFNRTSDIIVNVKQDIDVNSIVYVLLEGLQASKLINIQKVRAF